MESFNIFAINRSNDSDKVQLNHEPVSSNMLEKAMAFYLQRGEWLERGYFVKEEPIE